MRYAIFISTPTNFSGTAVSSTQINWSWSDNESGETAYYVHDAAHVALSTLAANATFWLETGLSPNTLYTRHANISKNGANDDSSPMSGYTLAVQPVSPTITAIGGSSVTLSWNGNGNPDGTQYRVAYWVLGGSTSTVDFSAANGTVNSLAPSTTYYLTVKAKNGDGIFSDPSEIITALTRPPAPANLSGAAMGVSSITWTWDGVATATQYKWYASTNGPGVLITGLSLIQTDLSPNMAYGCRLSAVNPSGEGSLSGAVTRHTLAPPPVNLSSASVTATTLTLNWSGSGTAYAVERATDAGGVPGIFVAKGTVSSSSFQDSGLSRATTYWYRIMSYNNDNVINPEPSSAIPIVTLVDDTPPTGSPTTPYHSNGTYSVSTALTFSWAAGDSADAESGISGYYAQITNLYNGDVGNTLTKTFNEAVAQSGLTYYARVRAKNGVGLYGNYSNWSEGVIVDTIPPAAPTITSPSHPDHNTAYAGGAPEFVVTMPWDANGTRECCYLIDNNPLSVPVPNGNCITTLEPSLDISSHSLMADGTWYFHVLAEDFPGNIGSTAHYKFIIKRVVDIATQNIFTFADGSTIDIPAGGLSSPTTIQLRVPVSTEIPRGAYDPYFILSGVVKDISLADGTTLLNGHMTISLKYTNADITGLNEDGLKISYYDAPARTWKVISNSAAYPAQKKVVAGVNHLTFFAITGNPSGGSSAVFGLTNYPNPFAAGAGRTTKIRYSLRADSAVELKIYDLLGKLVLERRIAAGASPGGIMGPNEVPWDGKNGNGDYVAPGGYICVVKSGDGKQKVKIGVK